ncbi:RNB domain-containing ribonuclease [Prescottella agglutinans]|uniref:Ribonuclease R n=1 Tax=Prescottella agglutinans TaxID=1644129 RepID=A0ABT6MK94_9NOCA|nr:RNB domain-containing ribonuclease [Prescottella agglutinans]MDH6284330.1 ribonuclease R [Prescottella agglutinans]
MTNTAQPLLMIDAKSSRDRDDAISVVPRPDGRGWLFEVHVAGVADVVAHGSAADENAFRLGETRYLPTRTIPMLGTEAEAAASLTETADRTSLQVAATLWRDGRLTDVTLRRSQIPAGRCVAVDHGEVPGILADPTHPLHAALAEADTAAQVLLGARRDSGALAFYDLTSGWAANEDGAIVAIAAPLRTNAYVIVQEMMIATNEAVAMWCVEQELPILFRNHRANPVAGTTDELMHELLTASGDPVLFDKIRGRMLAALRAATYEPTVHAHHGLRLAAYAHVTSPLRRLADLVSQRIIFAHLDGAAAPYMAAQLEAIGADLNRRAQERRETRSARYKNADKLVVAREASGDLAALDARRFSKVLKSLTAQPLHADLATELDRRARADLLTVSDAAVLVDVTDRSWRTVQLEVVDELSAIHPEMGPSVASAWRQAHPDQPEPTMETQYQGPDHARTFAARATHNGTRGPWMTAASKKASEQAAAWAAIRAHLGGADIPDTEPAWPDRAPAPQPAAVLPATPPGEEPPRTPAAHTHGATTVVAFQLDPSKKHKALSNPVAWLITLSRNEQLPEPEWTFDIDGPSHAPQFTATVHFGGRTQSVSAATKSGAKTQSATALVEDLFAIG